jgi:hypothetical protein
MYRSDIVKTFSEHSSLNSLTIKDNENVQFRLLYRLSLIKFLIVKEFLKMTSGISISLGRIEIGNPDQLNRLSLNTPH